ASGTNQQRYAAGPLAVDRAGAERAAAYIPHRPALLAYHAAPELRPFCVSQCNRHHRAAHQRVVCFGCDFYYPGNEPPAPRHDQGFQCTNAQGPGTSGPVAQNGAVPEFEPEATEETDIFLFGLCSLCLPRKTSVRRGLMPPLYAVCSC